jgi:hypothetical protein
MVKLRRRREVGLRLRGAALRDLLLEHHRLGGHAVLGEAGGDPVGSFAHQRHARPGDHVAPRGDGLEVARLLGAAHLHRPQDLEPPAAPGGKDAGGVRLQPVAAELALLRHRSDRRGDVVPPRRRPRAVAEEAQRRPRRR